MYLTYTEIEHMLNLYFLLTSSSRESWIMFLNILNKYVIYITNKAIRYNMRHVPYTYKDTPKQNIIYNIMWHVCNINRGRLPLLFYKY